MNVDNIDSKIKKDYDVILKSGQFDSEWYLDTYLGGDVGINPIIHFLEIGSDCYFNPNKDFDVKWYSKTYVDVKKSGLNPFVHYLNYGRFTGRLPKSLDLFNLDGLGIPLEFRENYLFILNSYEFDSEWYLNTYLDGDVNIDPILHFLESGVKLDYNPNPNFDVKWYLLKYPDVRKSGKNPFVHYLTQGFKEFKLPKLFTIDEIKELDIKLTLKGTNDYLFLYNDSNNELLQHFDINYHSTFDSSSFKEDLDFKNSFFNELGIPYFYHVVPDKSVVCKEFLPFKINYFHRNINKIPEIPDYTHYLNQNHYFPYDSHMNYLGGEVLSFNYINNFDNSFSLTKFYDLIDNSEKYDYFHINDLLTYDNWSYSEYERQLLDIKANIPHSAIKLNSKDLSIPEEFSKVGTRNSIFLKNENSDADLRILIFRDSSFNLLMPYFNLYFNEMFIYWDHLNFNKDLIDWFNPDIIMEIRIERFLENYYTPDWIKSNK